MRIYVVWTDEKHGKIIGGEYDGRLVKTGFIAFHFIQILLNHGWVRLVEGSEDEELIELKEILGLWLNGEKFTRLS